MSLHRLVYCSRCRIPHDDRLQAEVDRILAVSRRNNEASGVTGALMFDAGCFAQVLEGGRDALEATFERIQQDERHGEVAVLHFAPVPQRTFQQWSMGLVGAPGGRPGEVAGGVPTTGSGFSVMAGEHVFSLLRHLAMTEQQTHA